MRSFESWMVRALVALSRAFSIREAAARSGVPKTTLWRMLHKLEGKGSFRLVLKLSAFKLYGVVALGNKFENPFAVAVRTLHKPGSRASITTGITPDPPGWDWRGEWVRWNPDAAFRLGVLTSEGTVLVDRALEAADEALREWLELGSNVKQRAPDPVDALLIHHFLLKSTQPWRRYNVAPDKLEEVGATDKSLRSHWMRHVKPTWLYNTYVLYMDLNTTPMWLLVLSGSEASKLGVALAYLTPYAATLVGPEKVLVFLQIPARGLATVWSGTDSFSVKLEEFWVVGPSLVRAVPYFYRFLARKGRR